MQDLDNLKQISEDEILRSISSEVLNDTQISQLIGFGQKDVLIHLAKFQKLTNSHIKEMIPNLVYLATKYIISNQSFDDEVRNLLYEKISKKPSIYKELIAEFKELKW